MPRSPMALIEGPALTLLASIERHGGRQPYGSALTGLLDELQRAAAAGPQWSQWCTELRHLEQASQRLSQMYAPSVIALRAVCVLIRS